MSRLLGSGCPACELREALGSQGKRGRIFPRSRIWETGCGTSLSVSLSGDLLIGLGMPGMGVSLSPAHHPTVGSPYRGSNEDKEVSLSRPRHRIVGSPYRGSNQDKGVSLSEISSLDSGVSLSEISSPDKDVSLSGIGLPGVALPGVRNFQKGT